MTRRERDYIFDTLERIRDETHENNIMLRQIVKFINKHLAHDNQENIDDFGRNVLANLISNQLDLFK